MATSPDSGLIHSTEVGTSAKGGTPAATHVAFVGATAWAGSELVEFQQAGRGKPLLMLAPGAEAGTEPRLAQALANRFRVVLPTITLRHGAEPATPVGETIERLLDTLGFGRVVLVATPPYASAALAYALTDAERVERLVIFIDDRIRTGSSISIVSDRLADAGVALAALAWPDSQQDSVRDTCVTAVIDELTSFLSA